MKAIQFVIIASVILLGNACSLWPWGETTPAVDVSSTPTSAFQEYLRSAQQREVSAATRTATTREAYEKLKKDFKEADNNTKPVIVMQLASAQGDYMNAQQQHIESKRSLRRARDAYVYKRYLDKHPEVVEAAALDITAEAELLAIMTPPTAAGIPPVEIISEPQRPAEEGAVETGSDDRFNK